MRKVLLFSALSLALFATAIPTSADPLTLETASRIVISTAYVGDTMAGGSGLRDLDVMTDTANALDPGTGERATTTASLTSLMSAETRMFSGRGFTAVTKNSTTLDAGGESHASYFVVLDLTAPQRFGFAATYSIAGGNATTRSIWDAELLHDPMGPNPQTVFDFGGFSSQTVPFTSISETLSASDILAPGRYALSVRGESDSWNPGIGSSALDFTFALSFSDPNAPPPVPEPASMLLLGSGLAALAVRRRVRTNRAAKCGSGMRSNGIGEKGMHAD